MEQIHSREVDNASNDDEFDGVVIENPSFTCNSCGLEFISRDIQLGHFRSELHKFNLHRSLNMERVLSPAEYDAMQRQEEEEEGEEKVEEEEEVQNGEENQTWWRQEEDDQLEGEQSEDGKGEEEEGDEGETMLLYHKEKDYIVPCHLQSLLEDPEINPTSFRSWAVLLLRSGFIFL